VTRCPRLAALVLLAFGALSLGLGWLAPPSVAQDEAPAGPAPAEFAGPDLECNKELGCVKCHEKEYQAWLGMKHNHSLSMPGTDLAKGIKKALKIRGPVQRAELCQNCHFTVVVFQGEENAKYGISCESCHGPARGWVPIHSDRQRDRDERMAEAVKKFGMVSPTQLYDLAQNCYECHVLAKDVPGVEALVNTSVKVGNGEAHHSAGSADFELVAWSQGEVRHNFHHGKKDGEVNPRSEFLRGLFLVGKLLDVEYSLRGLANTTDGAGRYFASLEARLKGDKGSLAILGQAKEKLPADSPVRKAVETALETVAGCELKPGNKDALRAAAGKVQEAARAVFNDKTPADLKQLEEALAPIEPLLPAPEAYKGKVSQGK
jgi:hypothetical protein